MIFGDLTLSLVSRRWSRCLFMLRGWPFRMVGVLGDEALRTATIAEFKAGYEASLGLYAAQDTAATKAMLHRSRFADAAVEQWVQAWCLRRAPWCLYADQRLANEGRASSRFDHNL